MMIMIIIGGYLSHIMSLQSDWTMDTILFMCYVVMFNMLLIYHVVLLRCFTRAFLMAYISYD